MINFKIWLTALLVTSGVWVAFESGAKAQSGGSITIGNVSVTQNGTISNDSTTNPILSTNNSNTSVLTTNPILSTNNSNTSVNSTNSNSTGGNIRLEAGSIMITRVTSIPEPSFVGGILTVAVTAAVSRLKHKRK